MGGVTPAKTSLLPHKLHFGTANAFGLWLAKLLSLTHHMSGGIAQQCSNSGGSLVSSDPLTARCRDQAVYLGARGPVLFYMIFMRSGSPSISHADRQLVGFA